MLQHRSILTYILIATVSFTKVLAQTVKVIDATTLQPIPEVAVFNLDRSAIAQTNSKGIADLTPFDPKDILEFQHPSYKLIVLSYNVALNAGIIRLFEEIIQIEEVVITATKWEQSGEVPQSVVSISPSEINFYNPQTSADMLKSSGQVFVQKSQLGGGSPMIRGFAANAVLIAVNGVRMNNAIFRSGNLQNVINIDPNVLERADVILGPGSVIYGSDALGGVMNFRVKEPKFSITDKASFGSTTFLRYASANNEQTGHIHFNIGGRKLSWLSSFTYSGFSDLITGSKRTDKFPDYGRRYYYVIPNGLNDAIVGNTNPDKQVFSGFSSVNTVQRLKYRPGSNIDLTYDFFYSTTSNIPRYDRLIVTDNNQLKYAIWNYGPQKWMMNSLKLNAFSTTAFYEEMRVVLTNQQFEESRSDRRYRDPDLRTRSETVDVWTLNIDFEKEFGSSRQIVYGLEGIYNHVNSVAKTQDIETNIITGASTRYPDGGSDVSSIAAYASYQQELKENLLFSVGARYSYFALTSRFNDTTFYNFPYDKIDLNKGAITGNLSLVYSTTNHWKFDFLVGSGFRAPNVDDVGKVFDSEPGNVVVPNENLGPEFVYNGEIGITKTIPGVFEFGVTGFYSLLRDAMVRRDFTINGQDSIIYDGELSRVQALVNTGQAYIGGLSGNLQASFAKYFTLLSSVTIMNGLDTEDNIPLRHTTPAFGKTAITFRGNQFKLELSSEYQADRAFEDLAPSEQNKTHLYTTDGALGWNIFNFNISYQPNALFQINGAVENILDKHYRPYSSGISAPGRNFIFSLRVSI